MTFYNGSVCLSAHVQCVRTAVHGARLPSCRSTALTAHAIIIHIDNRPSNLQCIRGNRILAFLTFSSIYIYLWQRNKSLVWWHRNAANAGSLAIVRRFDECAHSHQIHFPADFSPAKRNWNIDVFRFDIGNGSRTKYFSRSCNARMCSPISSEITNETAKNAICFFFAFGVVMDLLNENSQRNAITIK